MPSATAGKWIRDLTATTPLAKAARRVLTVRFRMVSRYLPLAIYKADRDVENVHQLRVATRRARAALDIFACCLPSSKYRSAKKTLRRIRQAAGDARDWDVFLAALTLWDPPQQEQRAGRDFLLGYARAQRESAQSRLLGLDKTQRNFECFVEHTVTAVREPRQPDLKNLFDLAESLVLERFQAFTTALSGVPVDLDQLHELRIIGKRLRYALEIVAVCLAPAVRKRLYPAVEALQEILGEFNDDRVAASRLDTLASALRRTHAGVWKRLRPGLDARRRVHQTSLRKTRREFEDWKKPWHILAQEVTNASLIVPK